MEHWLLAWPTHYDALPLPAGRAWPDGLLGDSALPGLDDHLARISMSDGAQECPAVPPHLPRQLPRGTYRAALYHDAAALYIVLQATPGEPVLTRAAAAAHVGPLHERPFGLLLNLLSADGAWCHGYERTITGETRASRRPAAYGPRAPQPQAGPAPEFAFAERVDAPAYVAAWRLPRAALAEVIAHDQLRLALTCLCPLSLELVAWGTGGYWGVRADEALTVRLVAARHPAPHPTVERLVMAYDPAGETATFTARWRDPFAASERVDDARSAWRPIPSHHAHLTLNGASTLLPFSGAETTSPPLPLADGHNLVHLAHAGGESRRVWVEKRSGNRLAECPHPVPGEFPHDAILARVRQETAALLAEVDQRRHHGAELNLLRLPFYTAAACGRTYRYLTPDHALLEVLRDVADRALALQRPDGTFSGFHLGRAYAGKEPPRWAGGAYDSGMAGELWAVAAWVLGEEKYLAASRRLVAAYATYRVETNQNYAAFALFHLATHYRLTRDELALDHARYYARHLAARDLLPLGYQAGHNYYTVYGWITLRGLAMLAAVLPAGDPLRVQLREQSLRMGNQLLTRLQADGTYDSRDRYFTGERQWHAGLCALALLLGPADAARAEATIQLQLHAPPTTLNYRLVDNDFVRWYAHRQALRAGQHLDLLSLI